MDLKIWLIVIFLSVIDTNGTIDGEGCYSPQYLELGKSESINCFFRDDYFAILWFDTTEHQTNEPIVDLRKDAKQGIGYKSGEYDVHPNGSLIINRVALIHETNFTVYKLRSPIDDILPHIVEVVTIVYPLQTRPRMSDCYLTHEICFSQIHEDSTIECSVLNSRPPVRLSLIVRTESGDNVIPSSTNITHHSPTYSTTVSGTNVFRHSAMLAFVVCTETGATELLPEKNSFMLVQNIDYDILSVPAKRIYSKAESKVELICARSDISFVVWSYKQTEEDKSNVILYKAYDINTFTSFSLSEYELGAEGSLVIPHVNIKHEGTYSCMSGDGISEELRNYKLEVYVPSIPIVNGCNPNQYCIIDVTRNKGSLSCSVQRVHPKIQLEWREVKTLSSSSQIIFTDHETTNNVKEDLFDVFLTSKYEITAPNQESRITVECRIVSEGIDDMELAARFDLQYIPAITVSTEVVTKDKRKADGSNLMFLWLLCLVPVLFLSMMLIFYKGKSRKKNAKRKSSYPAGSAEEQLRMLPADAMDKMQRFIRELKSKYEGLYNAVYPVPYLRDRMYSVDKVFVESGIQEMTSPCEWVDLESYHDILKHSVNRFARIIIEGEPGFGKSTLSLQLVYDWCNGISPSPLRYVQIVILLRLRQLGGVRAIEKAIRQYILPIDSQFSEDDVKDILQKCSSILIILDGFDEYPDQESESLSDIQNIIKGDMFRDACVILTTRMKCLPKDYAPQSKRMRLAGFNRSAQISYIQKAVVKDFMKGEKIHRRLNENVVLSDLCQVPLFFVMFAHMTHEDKNFQKFRSVSTCFRYVIECFHAHLRNKSSDKSVMDLEKEHKRLDQVAFEALKGSSQTIVWHKEELIDLLDENCYNYYIRVGILVEEEILKENSGRSLRSSMLVQYKTEVRFFHKLFCEWYAAHYLADNVIKDETILNSEGMNPFDLQYVFRFACGLNSDAAAKIIDYVSGLEDGGKFSTLCLLEQTGKMETVLDTIRKICANDVIFGGSDSKLLQRSTVQLLEMASSNGIEIPRVELYDCVTGLDSNLGSLVLSSGILFPKLSSVNEMVVYEDGKEMSIHRAQEIISFGEQCNGMKTLGFYRCILPQYVGKVNRNADLVIWWSPSTGSRYRLNRSGKWETNDGRKLTDDEYQREIHQFNERQNRLNNLILNPTQSSYEI